MKIIFLPFFVVFVFIIQLSAQHTDAYIDDFRVNDDATNRTQFGSRIGVDSTGNFVVAWNDRRNFPNFWTQVFCQIFDKNGTRIGNNFKIGLDTTYLLGLTALNNGKFVCFWINFFNDGDNAELYFQRFNRFGNPIQQPLRVVDSVFFKFSIELR